MRSLILVGFGLLVFGLAVSAYAQTTDTDTKRAAFVKPVLERIEKSDKATKKDTDEIKSLHATWKTKKDDKSWHALNIRIMEIGKQLEISSEVTISAVDGNGQDQPGLTVKYQLVGVRGKPTTGKNLTTDVEKQMPIGYYYIWAERDGTAVSDTNSEYPIINTKEPVTLRISG